MCGIVGMLNLQPYMSLGRQTWFKTALFVDQIRGPHSTGVILVPRFDKLKQEFPKTRLHKMAVDAAEYLEDADSISILNHTDDAAVVIGHNRYATMGKVNDKNAHPFYTDHIGMVHNGSLDNRTGLEYYHEVDSASIALQLHHTPPEEYITLLKELEGAFCLVWFNENNQTFFSCHLFVQSLAPNLKAVLLR